MSDEQKAERAAIAPLTDEERAKILDPTFGGSPDAIFSAVLGILGNRGIDVPAVVKMNPAHIIFYLDDVKHRTDEIPSLSAKVDELAKMFADLDGTRRELIQDVASVRAFNGRIVERLQGLERHDADAQESRKLHSATLAHLAQTEDSLVEGSIQTDKRVDEITHRVERLASTTLRGMEDVLARIDAMARRVGTVETELHGDVAKWRESIDGRIGEIAADVRELIGARNRHEEEIYASSAKAEQARESAALTARQLDDTVRGLLPGFSIRLAKTAETVETRTEMLSDLIKDVDGKLARWRDRVTGDLSILFTNQDQLAREFAKTSHGTDAAAPATENLESAAPARWVTPAWNVKPGINEITLDPPIQANAGDTIGVALEMPAGTRVYGGYAPAGANPPYFRRQLDMARDMLKSAGIAGEIYFPGSPADRVTLDSDPVDEYGDHADTFTYTVDGRGRRKYETPTITLIGPPAAPVDDVAGEYVDDDLELIDDEYDSDPAWGLVVVRVSRDGETRIEGPAASAAIFWEAWSRVDEDRGNATT